MKRMKREKFRHERDAVMAWTALYTLIAAH